MNHILIIDDDVELAGLFAEYLRQEGFSVTIAHDGLTGLGLALTGQFALAVLDIMLPDIKGTRILARIREQSRLPVLMFTAKGDDVDRIIGLEAGADDYVPKPCTPRELVARIRAILRRSDTAGILSAQDGPITAGPLRIWSDKRKAFWFKQELELTSTEFELLQVLACQVGNVVSKNELSAKALGRPLGRFDRSIDVHMSSIRQKLGQQADGRSYIQTVRGKGYQLVRE
ncbi:response regulator transcription factor [Methylomonas methanica]|uniref:response regulator transcription factor n=1 Tax=Methylomonas methanica TaxID=421 RepID=UPI00059B569B|nr:response regulator transcription factor [Methylomonas methanica]